MIRTLVANTHEKVLSELYSHMRQFREITDDIIAVRLDIPSPLVWTEKRVYQMSVTGTNIISHNQIFISSLPRNPLPESNHIVKEVD